MSTPSDTRVEQRLNLKSLFEVWQEHKVSGCCKLDNLLPAQFITQLEARPLLLSVPYFKKGLLLAALQFAECLTTVILYRHMYCTYKVAWAAYLLNLCRPVLHEDLMCKMMSLANLRSIYLFEALKKQGKIWSN